MDEPQKIERPKVTFGRTHRIKISCGNIYIVVNRDESLRVIEIFVILGKAGGCAAAQLEALARTVSRGLRYGVPYDDAVKDLRGIRCHSPIIRDGEVVVASCADAIGKILEEELEWSKTEEFQVVMKVEIEKEHQRDTAEEEERRRKAEFHR